MRKYNLAIVGTGAVGQTISILAERNFPVNNLKLLYQRSAGK